MSVAKYILSVLILSGIIALVGYYYFGGFNKRELEVVEVDDYHFIGKMYQGKLQDKKLEETFYEVRQQYEKKEPAGTFAIVVLQEPETGKDSVEQFIGILTGAPVAENTLPSGWENYTVEAGQAVRSTIRAHNLVMAKPNIIKEEIAQFAAEKGLSLQPNITIEKYLGDRHLEVEVPVE